jgi:YidC/Oxa1 family membrane protein insertase
VDKRTVAAIVLIGLIIILYPWYLRLLGISPVTPPEQEEVVSQPQEELQEEEHVFIPPTEAPQVLTTTEELESRVLRIESPFFRGHIDTKGGVLTSWEIKPRFRDPQEQEWVKLLPTFLEQGALGLSFSVEGRPVDMDKLIFKSEVDSLMLNVSQPEGSIRLSAETAQGIRVLKELSFHYRRHSIGLRIKVEGAKEIGDTRQYTLWWKPGLSPTEERLKDDLGSFAAHTMLGDEVVRSKFSRAQVIKDSSFTGNTKWLAIQTKYFLIAMIPPSDVNGLGVKIRGLHEKGGEGEDQVEQRIISAGIHMPLQAGACDHRWDIYVGPIDYFVLKEYDLGLERIVNLGFRYIRWIGLLILRFFVTLYRAIPNYGVVIILFSIVIKFLFYPLTRKSFESMEKMREIQPKISELREKYKSDPAKLNKATIELYRKYKINPASGCFPMLLQMPVFIALYAVFRNTIELRGERFLWIKDLSAPDTVFHLPTKLPLYGDAFNILPIIMAVTMFLQQKASMKDPKQAYMVYLMPIFLFFLFNNFSSGLVLYWTMFNLLTLLQEQIRHRRKAALVNAEAGDEK